MQMASKHTTEVIIDGKIFTLGGYESEEYLQKVAAYINNKITELKQQDGYKKLTFDVQKTLLDLNIADDYFKTQAQAESLKSELENKKKELTKTRVELAESKHSAENKLADLKRSNESIEKEKENLVAQLITAKEELVRYEARISEMTESEQTERKQLQEQIETLQKEKQEILEREQHQKATYEKEIQELQQNQQKSGKKHSSKHNNKQKKYPVSKPVDLPVNVINDDKIIRTSDTNKLLSTLQDMF